MLAGWCVGLLILIAAISWEPIAFAQPQRPRQDYGRPAERTTVGDVLFWPPRLLLFPLWLVSEYVVRRPIGALVVQAERGQWTSGVASATRFGATDHISLVPTALMDVGVLPHVGFNLRWDDFLATPNVLRTHVGFWGKDWIALRLTDRYALAPGSSIALDVRLVRRQDSPFYGIGPRSSPEGRVRFQSTEVEGAWDVHHGDWSHGTIDARAGVRSMSFGLGSCCDSPSLESAVARGAIAAPPGFQQSYTALFQRVELVLESRRSRYEAGAGAKLDTHAEGGFVPSTYRSAPREAWLRYGGAATVESGLTGIHRVISLTLAAELSDPLLGVVPFTEQASLGGDRFMRGYLRNRLVDRSALVGAVRYTWPVWVFLNGVVEVDVGNVFGEHFSGAEAKLLRMTSGIGLRSHGERNEGFELFVAGGTDPFEHGFHVSSARFLLGYEPGI